ncbi:hypothetical protein K8354_05975 [Polaribacter litorisediminis]|uniref:hypothetical protein n=1 Tax=Polaribacter litorisediminis TaxID=1908341 RepID=UPI001CBB2BC4|nr:hypothetical protein [Polaribacter litorisediminis]UAM99358.1 hypothetical protein K8354_05975 [Polaribacter litorisediminis]
MIIKLDDTLINFCGLQSNDQNDSQIFELLADVRIRGFHFVIGSRKLLRLLGSSKFISEKAKKLYQKLYNNYTTEMAISASVDFTLNIIDSKKSNTTNDIFIDIHDLNDNTFLLRNKLLLENTVDSNIYSEIINKYITQNSLNAIQYNWDVSMGGGTTTHNEFKRITNENLTYTLCVLDSDKTSPHSNLGGTALQFITKPILTDFGEFYILPVHEMENLYPVEIISAISNGIPKFIKNKKIINKLSTNKNCDSFCYIDLKKGLNIYTLYNLNVDCRDYWINIFDKIGYNTKKCSCIDKNCRHFLIYPFGRNIADEIIDFVSKIGVNIKDLLNSIYEEIWLEIGKLLFEKFCCPKFIPNI